MENKKGLSVVLLIPTVIIGVALFEQFDIETLKFKKPAMAIVYFIGFILSIIFQLKGFKKRFEKQK